MYIYEGLHPLPPAPFDHSMTRGFDICWSCLLACLLASATVLALLASSFGLKFCLGWLWISIWTPWGYPGHGLGLGLAQGLLDWLACTPAHVGAVFYQDPGIQVTAKVEGDLHFLCPTINLPTA